MSNVVQRLVTKVVALFGGDWAEAPGRRFRQTVDIASRTFSELAPDSDDTHKVLAEGARRVVLGKVSLEHAEACKNYAEAESVKIANELARRTLEDRVLRERAERESAQSQARIGQLNELMARVTLLDTLQARECIPVMGTDGKIAVVKCDSPGVWEAIRERLLTENEIALLGFYESQKNDEEKDS